MMDGSFERRVARQTILEWKSAKAPLDRVLNETLREHRVGSVQRPLISEIVYKLVRFWPTLMGGWLFEAEKMDELRRLDKALVEVQKKSREELLELHAQQKPRFEKDPLSHLIQLHGAPRFLAEEIVDNPPPQLQAWHEFLHQCFYEAPFTVRLRPSKLTSEQFEEKFAEFKPEPSSFIPHCFHLDRRFQLSQREEFQGGLLEIQDESSQLISWLAKPQSGERILDLCAGAGGKSLHLAELMGEKGEIHAYDVATPKLAELAKRARKAGYSNIRTLEHLPKRSEKYDLVVVDAPCSALGTLRRGPERLSFLNEADVLALEKVQRELFELGLEHLAPGGRLVYATCTIRPSENVLRATQIVQARGKEWQSVGEILEKAIGKSRTARLLTHVKEIPAAQLSPILPQGCMQVGPSLSSSLSQASGGWRGDGFFVALVK